jgi:hypothetical protein
MILAQNVLPEIKEAKFLFLVFYKSGKRFRISPLHYLQLLKKFVIVIIPVIDGEIHSYNIMYLVRSLNCKCNYPETAPLFVIPTVYLFAVPNP